MKTQGILRYVTPEDVVAIGGAEFGPRGLVEGRGAGRYRAEQQGIAIEFAGHREYVVGDDVRHFDWRVFYRTARRTTRQYYQETNFTVRLVMDAGESMTYPAVTLAEWRRPVAIESMSTDGAGISKLAYASALSVLFAMAVTRRRDAFGLHLLSDSTGADVPPSASPAQVSRCIASLDVLQPTPQAVVTKKLASLGDRLGRREAIVLLSDGNSWDMTEFARILRRWRAAKHDVVFGHLLHGDEVTFPFEEFSYFEAITGTGHVSADGREIRRRYLERLAAFRSEVQTTCAASGAVYWPIDTRAAAGETLQHFFLGRRRR